MDVSKVKINSDRFSNSTTIDASSISLLITQVRTASVDSVMSRATMYRELKHELKRARRMLNAARATIKHVEIKPRQKQMAADKREFAIETHKLRQAEREIAEAEHHGNAAKKAEAELKKAEALHDKNALEASIAAATTAIKEQKKKLKDLKWKRDDSGATMRNVDRARAALFIAHLKSTFRNTKPEVQAHPTAEVHFWHDRRVATGIRGIVAAAAASETILWLDHAMKTAKSAAGSATNNLLYFSSQGSSRWYLNPDGEALVVVALLGAFLYAEYKLYERKDRVQERVTVR